MTDVISAAAIAAIIGIAVGFLFGRGRRATSDDAVPYPDLRPNLSDLVKSLQTGRVSKKGGGKDVEAVRAAIADWIPKASGRDVTFRTALRRMHSFLVARIDAPLKRGLEGPGSLSAAVKEARAAVQDLEVFLVDPSGSSMRSNLTELVRSTAADFANEWDVSLRIGPPEKPVHVMANADAFQDALYLVLHNAAQFSSKGVVSVEIQETKGWGRVLVRDDGPGFTPDGLSRAYDPFYSTTEGGLGVGLSHARLVVEEQGGRIHLRNSSSGGAEVEIALPLSR